MFLLPFCLSRDFLCQRGSFQSRCLHTSAFPRRPAARPCRLQPRRHGSSAPALTQAGVLPGAERYRSLTRRSRRHTLRSAGGGGDLVRSLPSGFSRSLLLRALPLCLGAGVSPTLPLILGSRGATRNTKRHGLRSQPVISVARVEHRPPGRDELTDDCSSKKRG